MAEGSAMRALVERRAFELSLIQPARSAEEQWLQAEQEVREEARQLEMNGHGNQTNGRKHDG